MDEKLILFDVNGIFGIKSETGDIQLPHYAFKLRPGIEDFLKKFDCQIGIFSSTAYSNVTAILKHIPVKFSPLLDRSMTCFDPDTNNHETIKLLTTFWNNPIHNRERKWNASNTLLVDNSASKVRFNDDKNVLVVDEYNPEIDDDLDELYNLIMAKL